MLTFNYLRRRLPGSVFDVSDQSGALNAQQPMCVTRVAEEGGHPSRKQTHPIQSVVWGWGIGVEAPVRS